MYKEILEFLAGFEAGAAELDVGMDKLVELYDKGRLTRQQLVEASYAIKEFMANIKLLRQQVEAETLRIN